MLVEIPVFGTSVNWHNMFQKAEMSFCYCFGKIIFLLQLGIWTTRAQFREDTFTIYHDKTLTTSNDVIIYNSVSLTQCITKCRSNVKCCSASYSKITIECQLDISGSCNSEKISAFGWITIIKDNFIIWWRSVLLMEETCGPGKNCPPATALPRDCSNVCGGSDVYQIFPNTSNPNGFDVYCDFGSDGNTWTVIQRRIDGKTDFYRGWSEYEVGFGDLTKEFWLGNEKLHKMTEHDSYLLRIELEDFENRTRYAEYQSFTIGNAESKYRLQFNGYSGDAGDSLNRQNGMKFSTKDQDNDMWGYTCATSFCGAWWFNECHDSNLNGMYLDGNHASRGEGIVWRTWKGYLYSLKSTKMMIRRQ